VRRCEHSDDTSSSGDERSSRTTCLTREFSITISGSHPAFRAVAKQNHLFGAGERNMVDSQMLRRDAAYYLWFVTPGCQHEPQSRERSEDKRRFSSAFLSLYGSLLERHTRRKSSRSASFTVQDFQFTGPMVVSDTVEGFPEQWFTQPVDHFSQDSPTFRLRYWVNKRHYASGTNEPVTVIRRGETSGEDRLPFLDTDIADTKATDGIGVVLEHWYVRVGNTPVTSRPPNRFSTGSIIRLSRHSRVLSAMH
jgi:hypothetical protein